LFYSSSLGESKEQERIKRRGRGGGGNKNKSNGQGREKDAMRGNMRTERMGKEIGRGQTLRMDR
jgi:hypothetical protein